MKKRIISVILCALMLLSIIPMGLASALVAGDIDGDTSVSAADARLVLRASVGLETLTPEQIKAADTDLDGAISAADARLVLRASVGLENLHSHQYTGKTTKAATCTADGVMTYSCSCGESYTQTIAKTGHKNATKETNRKEATCSKAGSYNLVTYCSTCNVTLKTEAKTIPATGNHSWKAATCTAAKTCSLCQTTTGSALGHTTKTREENRKEATCSKAGSYDLVTYCTKCNAVISRTAKTIPALTTHTLEITVVEADCITSKYEMKKCKHCDYIDPDYFVELAPANGHKFSDPTVTPATCQAQGYTSKTCSVCTATEKYDYTEILPHTDRLVSQTNPTCKQTGVQKVICTRCNREENKLIPLSACKADDPVYVAGDNDTLCKEIYNCKTCGKTMYEVETHRLRATGSSTTVTCTENGTIDMACRSCYYTVTQVSQPALGHDASIDMSRSHYATCDEEGQMVYTDTCKRCGTSLDGEVITIPAKGHLPEGTQTCTTSVVCTREDCGQTLEEALGHSMKITSAWAVNSGAHAFFCDRCGTATTTTNADKIANFNAITTAYKTYNGTYTTRYFTKSYTDSTYKTFDFGIYTSMIEDMYKEEMGKSEDEYTPIRAILTKQSPVSDTQFSKLNAYDLQSITVERLSGLTGAQVLADFNPGYDPSISSQLTSYNNFTRYKSINVNENVIKVTMDVNNENLYTIVNNNIEETALQRIYEFDIRQQVNGYTLSGGKYVMTEAQTGDGYEMSMTMTVESIDTDAKVTFYLLESTYEPLMAIYDIYDTIDSNVNMTFKIGISIKGKMRPVIKSHNTSVFVFEKPIQKFIPESVN